MPADYVGIAGWLKNSFIDYPGTVSTVLFFSGCNLRCPYCHNPGIVHAKASGTIDHSEVLAFLEKRRGLIDGVVLSGGEPTLHPKLADLALMYREMGYKVKLDSNGLLPERIRKCKPDYLALDVKTHPERYNERVGAQCTDISERLATSIDIVRSMEDQAEIRITAAPGFIDRDSALSLGPMLAGVKRLYLQPVRINAATLDTSFAERGNFDLEELRDLRSIFSEFVDTCEIRGSA